MQLHAKQNTTLLLYLSLCGVLAILEFMINPFPFKLGIANVVVLYAFYKKGTKEGIYLLLFKVAINFVLNGFNVVGIALVISNIMSLTAIIFLKKHFSVIAVSVSSSFINLETQFFIISYFLLHLSPAQIFTFAFLVEIVSVLNGFVVGFISYKILIHTLKLQVKNKFL